MMLIAAAVLGLIIGSFLSVCIYRIPYGRPMGPPSLDELSREEPQDTDEPALIEVADSHAEDEGRMSISHPRRSICPHCRRQLRWWHNIPLLSWILLGGKCAFCKKGISFRYPLVELLSAACAVMSLHEYGLTATALLIYIFACALIVISFIDIDYYIIPDVISLPGCVIGVLAAIANHFFNIFSWPVVPSVWSSLAGLVFGGGVLLLISEIYFRLKKRDGLGMGDVKLLALTGAFFGIEGALYTMFLGSLFGAVVGVMMIIVSGRTLTHQLPFGPYLAFGTMVYLFAYESLFGIRPPPLIG